jgi:hypothetical protein
MSEISLPARHLSKQLELSLGWLVNDDAEMVDGLDNIPSRRAICVDLIIFDEIKVAKASA